MSELRVDILSGEAESQGPTFVGVVTFSGTEHIQSPSGTTSQRPSDHAINPGTIRFNRDSKSLEYYDGLSWWQISEFQNNSGRGLVGGGYPTFTDIDYITISTTGNAQDFGDLYSGEYGTGAVASDTRAVWAGGSNTNILQYVTISSTGNSVDFGDLTQIGRNIAPASSRTRGIFAGRSTTGPTNNYNTIDYITIASIGNAVDFGDLLSILSGAGGCSSPTRGVFAGGSDLISRLDVIQYVTIATTGNSIDFGDLSVIRDKLSGCSSSTRGLFGGGGTDAPVSNLSNVIDYITISSLGNATDFGDLTQSRDETSSCSSSVRGVWTGGRSSNSPASVETNVIDYITIDTTGNATDFGDLVASKRLIGSCSNAHGGL